MCQPLTEAEKHRVKNVSFYDCLSLSGDWFFQRLIYRLHNRWPNALQPFNLIPRLNEVETYLKRLSRQKDELKLRRLD